MVRVRRLKFGDPDEGYYHVTSRCTLKAFLLHKEEKEKFIEILQWLAGVFFVEVITYSVMTNHFHLVLKMIRQRDISDEEFEERLRRFYLGPNPTGDGVILKHWDPYEIRSEFGNISVFMQELKQRFTWWYHRQHGTWGHVWGQRFHSVLIEGHEALRAVMLYVDLNSVRANMVQRPERYPYCGLAQYLKEGQESHWLSHRLLKEVMTTWSHQGESDQVPADPVRRYLQMVYERGLLRPVEKVEDHHVLAQLLAGPTSRFLRPLRALSEGLIVGPKEACERMYKDRWLFYFSRFRSGRKATPILPKAETTTDPPGESPPSPLAGLHTMKTFRS